MTVRDRQSVPSSRRRAPAHRPPSVRSGEGPQAIKWQPILTLKGELPGADPVEVVQPASAWLDTANFNNVVVRTDIMRIDTNCHLYLETAVTANGPWHEAADLTSAGVSETMLMSGSSTDLLGGYLRWRYESTLATGTPWTVCFKMTVYPVAENQRKLNLKPRVA